MTYLEIIAGMSTTNIGFIVLFLVLSIRVRVRTKYLVCSRMSSECIANVQDATGGPGTQMRNFIYVKDLADAVTIAAESENTGKGEILNIGSGISTTMEDVAKAIGGEITFIPMRKFEVEAHQANMDFTNKMLNWSFKVNILDWVSAFEENNREGL